MEISLVSHPKMKENMELLKFNSNHGDIKVAAYLVLLKIPSKIYKSDSKVKALVAVTDTDTDKVLHKIRKWNLNVESQREWFQEDTVYLQHLSLI